MTAEHTPEQLALARVTREDAIEWMECAMRNFQWVRIDPVTLEPVPHDPDALLSERSKGEGND